jgi:nucleoside-diphosphate-sugar epimerase
VQSILAAWGKLQKLSWAWGRVFFLYGPGEHPDRLVAYVIRSLLGGRPARCASGKPVRDFMHVQDVAGAFVSLLDSEVQGPVNIASGQGVPLCDMVRRIADIQGKPNLVELGAIPDRPDEPASLVADVRRLRDEVGFAPTFTLDDGLAQTIQWWRENLRQ